jgi:methyl-accepting chemotaxis protein
MVEQARALREMTVGAENVARQITDISRVNREHSLAAESILKGLVEVRSVAETNAEGVLESQKATTNLRERTRDLAALADRLGQNGPAPRKRR